MHTAFFLLLAASLGRYLIRHPGAPATGWVIIVSTVLAMLYVLGPALGNGPSRRRLVWLGAVVGAWVILVLLAPSFAWCAVPLFYSGLRTLPRRAALVLVVVLTAFVVGAQVRLSGFDLNLVVAPPAVAAIAMAVFVHTERQSERIAATERREGTLAERQRLAMEIHDSLAQGLSSQQMLLQAADRMWDSDPDKARAHVRTAESFAERNLAEARRFVHDLAPADLAEGGGLEAALRALAERESATVGAAGAVPLTVQVRVDGAPVALPERVQSALLRIAQGALANVREHAGARFAALTLSYLDDQVILDIADDGRGFEPGPETEAASAARSDATRGHGLPAMRARVRQLGGALTVESRPGEGTFVSATVPCAPGSTPAAPEQPTASEAPRPPQPPTASTPPDHPQPLEPHRDPRADAASPDAPPARPGSTPSEPDASSDPAASSKETQ
ncbi:sensor histidine kinase [Streptomyces triticagri]|uniref:Oxygen sensor histidine kinase NreB n=1 Tax=Streptomyces triticagri TaxID=2293568 RepID=A0A372M7P1_9ACTN|nr:sensor histidine kinase [Streptomyces triticagri]RFU86956.1 sensor histidine kinase [Streptomyces triticagri]